MNCPFCVFLQWAIYCLVLLYRSTREELQPLHKPYSQFLCIKMTICGANFQGLIIAVLVDTGALKPNPDWGMSNSQFAALVQVCNLKFMQFAL